MLQITIPAIELWDETKEEFIYAGEQTLRLEHSLASLSKWESKWCKPFLVKEPMTHEETIDYIKCMTLSDDIPSDVYDRIPNEIVEQVLEYINAKMTATWFSEKKRGKTNSEQITNELIYYWMITLNIPFECENWHLNRLLTLIKVCDIKNSKPEKMSKKEMFSRRAAMNAARKKKLNTKG